MRSKEFWVEHLGEEWVEVLKPLLKSTYMEKVMNTTQLDYSILEMFPISQKDIFRAFKLCPFDKMQIVVIGTEPNQHAGNNGLAFGDDYSTYHNSSAMAIHHCIELEYRQLNLDFDFTFESWAKQGVLMLNRSLTAQQNNSKSDRDKWKKFFGYIIYLIEFWKPGTIFLLWGKEAQKYSELLSQNNHVFSWEHPMTAHNKRQPWGCPNFKQIDKLLESLDGGSRKIIW